MKEISAAVQNAKAILFFAKAFFYFVKAIPQKLFLGPKVEEENKILQQLLAREIVWFIQDGTNHIRTLLSSEAHRYNASG